MNRRLSIVVFLLSLLLCFEASAQSRVNYEAIDRMTKEEVMAEIRSTEAGLEKAEADYRRAKGKGGLDGELERQYHAEEVRIGKEILKALRAKLKEFEAKEGKRSSAQGVGCQSSGGYSGLQEGELDWMADKGIKKDLENTLEMNRREVNIEDVDVPSQNSKSLTKSEGVNRLRSRNNTHRDQKEKEEGKKEEKNKENGINKGKEKSGEELYRMFISGTKLTKDEELKANKWIQSQTVEDY